jgi:tRNA pseudouridine55 synthase
MNGVLIIDKPQGLTSFDVVRRLRDLFRVKKAGHTGTLDPMATGVLPVCIGDATKVAAFILEGDKAYDAVIRLGVETDTQDATGRVLTERPVPSLTRQGLEEVLVGFRGTFEQTPPMYSAVKIAGKRLYERARAGEEVVRAPRTVTVHTLALRDFSASEVTLSVQSSKGFYVRTLAHDIGERLGCGAHLKALRRTQSGPFSLAQALPLAEAESLWRDEAGRARLTARLLSAADALAELPAWTVSERDVSRVAHGVPLECSVAGRVRVVGPSGQLLAVADATAGRLVYRRVLV